MTPSATIHRTFLASLLLTLLPQVSQAWEEPDWIESEFALHSEWLDFTSAFGDPGNAPDVEGSDAGGTLKQLVPGAIITGTKNIYNPAGASSFRLDHTAQSTYQEVFLQVRITGAIDPGSVALRNGERSFTTEMVEYERVGSGFGDTLLLGWHWDLSGEDISGMQIQLDTDGSHSSLASARLDVLLQEEDGGMPGWIGSPRSRFSEWLDFTSAFGEPGNAPDIEGSNAGGTIKQLVPGAIISGTKNIYNPAGASSFRLDHSAQSAYQEVFLKVRITGSIDPGSVVLRSGDRSFTTGMVEYERVGGGFGDTLLLGWRWDLSGEDISGMQIQFDADGSHSSLSSARLDVLLQEEAGELIEASFETPSGDRWDYPRNATPGTRARASVFGFVQEGVGAFNYGTFIVVFDTSGQIPPDLPPESYHIESLDLRLMTSDNFEAYYDPTPDSAFTTLPEEHEQHVPDEDPGRPVHVYGAGFRGGYDAGSWVETAPHADPDGDGSRNVFPAMYNAEDGSFTDAYLAVDFSDLREPAPLGTGLLQDTDPGDSIPYNAWMHFPVETEDTDNHAYLQQGLSQGKLCFVYTSLSESNGGTTRTYPEFHTSNSLLTADPSLEISVRVQEVPAQNGVRIARIESTSEETFLEFSPPASGKVRILWTGDFASWEAVDQPVLETLSENLVRWSDPAPDPRMRFYRITAAGSGE